MENQELATVTRIYEAYGDSKERFTERNFATNRFYLGITLTLLVIAFFVYALTPLIALMLLLATIGFIVSVLWWMNINTYQGLIKVKYGVLEKLEEHLPVKPYREEFKEMQEARKKNKKIVFSDLQKTCATIMILIFLAIFVMYSIQLVKRQFQANQPKPIPVGQTVIDGDDF